MRNQICIYSTRVWIILLLGIWIPLAPSLTQVTIKERVQIIPSPQGNGRDHPQIYFISSLQVTTSLDTLSIFDTTNIQAEFIDPQTGLEITSIDPNKLLTFSLDSTRWGSFVDPMGNVVSSPLANVKYGDARNGRVRFVPKKVPDTTSLKSIVITIVDDSTFGSKSILVGKMRLTFLEKLPRQIWPFIEDTSKGSNRAGYEATRGFSVLVKNPVGKVQKSQIVMLQSKLVIGSGGHGHVKSGLTNLFRGLRGTFYAQHYVGDSLSNLLTDTNGVMAIDSFRTSKFSGNYVITATLKADTTVSDSVLLTVRADTLVDLGTGPTWTLVGNSGDPGGNHVSNHWSTQKAKDSLIAGLTKFNILTKSKAGGGKGLTPRINDMSLQWGGDFDIWGDWQPGADHEFHRVGLSVDISRLTLEGVVLKDSTGIKKKGQVLIDCMAEFGGVPYEEQPIHFGFDGGN